MTIKIANTVLLEDPTYCQVLKNKFTTYKDKSHSKGKSVRWKHSPHGTQGIYLSKCDVN